jgi:hypothetical protein
LAHFDHVSRDLRIKVARELSEFIDQRSEERLKYQPPEVSPEAGEESETLQLGESLTVWQLTRNAFEALGKSKLPGDLIRWVEPTPFLYHQIWLRGKIAGFARSYSEETVEENVLFHVSASEFAASVNQLLEKIEHNDQKDSIIATDPVVRLLEIPPFQVYALWVFTESQQSLVAIIDAAERYKELTRGSFLNSQQFLGALSEVGPIAGVI